MATDENKCTGVQVLDPVEGLVDYVRDVKPYHTKIVEVLIEYVYGELLDVRITDDMHLQVDIDRPADADFGPGWCDEGFSLLPFGNPNRWPILSPNQSVDMEDYPAINSATNQIHVPGFRADNIRIGDRIQIISQIEDWSDPNYGTDAYQPQPGIHTGFYTVTNIEFKPKQVDTWPGHPATGYPNFIFGDEPHTVITLAESLLPIPGLTATQAYVAFMIQEPVLIEDILPYSNPAEVYDPNIPSLTNEPDEGWSRKDILAVTLSTLDGFGQTVPDSGKVVISGKATGSNIFVGDKLSIFRSTGNDGIYTISSMAYDDLTDQTTFGVLERIRNTTPDGYARIDVPSNVFIVDGNHTSRFVQGFEFNIIGGTFNGRYMTLNSKFVNGKTRIRPSTDIIDRGTGYKILGGSTGLHLPADLTSKFPVGTRVIVSGSPANDGSFTVTAVSFDSVDDITIVELNEPVFDEVGGEVFPFDLGTITDKTYGWGEGSDMCNHVPETRLHVQIEEQLTFSNIELDLHDDLIVYNMENSDRSGYELPIETVISSFAPVIVDSNTPPPAPVFNDLWFDESTATGVLRRWTGQQWAPIHTAYWLDSNENLLYYRTMGAYSTMLTDGIGGIFSSPTISYDTGWTLMLAHPPGFNDVQPAIPRTRLLGRESFYATDFGFGVVPPSYEFKSVTFDIVAADDNVSTLDAILVDGDIRPEIRGMDLLIGPRQMIVNGSGLGDGTYTIAHYVYMPDTDRTHIFVEEPVVFTMSTGTVTIEPLSVPMMDLTLIKVFVNGVIAEINMLSNSEFEILSPRVYVNDQIRAEIFATDRFETNANVNEFEVVPHRVYHDRVTHTPSQTYELYGGNYLHRLIPTNRLEVYSDSGLIEVQRPASFAIPTVDLIANTITVEGEYNWLYTPATIMATRTSIGTIVEYTVVSSVFDGTNTVVTVAEDVIGKPSTITNHHFTKMALDLFEINNTADQVIVYGNYVNVFTPDRAFRLSDTRDAVNDNLTLTVQSVSYDQVNGRTVVTTNENLPNPNTPRLEFVRTFLDLNRIGAGIPADPYRYYILISGNLVDDADGTDLTSGRRQLTIRNTTDAYNDGIYDIAEIDYDFGADETRIYVRQPIPTVRDEIVDLGGEMVIQIMGRVHPAVFEEYVEAVGGVYDPIVSSNANDQVKTRIVPATAPHATVSAVAYLWYSPLQMSIGEDRRDDVRSQLRDRNRIDGEALMTGNTFEVVSSDPNLDRFGFNGDIRSFYAPEQWLTIVGSPTHEGSYTIERLYYDGAGDLLVDGYVGNNQIVIPGFYPDKFIQEFEFSLYVPVDDDPTNVFSDNVGNYVAEGATYDSINDETTITVTAVLPDLVHHGVERIRFGGTDKTYIYVAGDVNVISSGPLGMAVLENLVLEEVADPSNNQPGGIVASANIEDELTFGWGAISKWDIIATDAANDTITIAGDITGILDMDDSGSIHNSDGNDGDYDIASWTADAVSTTITLAAPGLSVDPNIESLGYFQLDNVDATDWYQYVIVEANSTTNTFTVNGNPATNVMPGMEFRVFGTTNDGIYQALTISPFDVATNTTEIGVASIANDETGGWIESYRDYGIRIVLEDTIGVAVAEEATSALIQTGGSLIDGFDYTYFDVGSLDEDVVTVRRLYGNTFTS